MAIDQTTRRSGAKPLLSVSAGLIWLLAGAAAGAADRPLDLQITGSQVLQPLTDPTAAIGLAGRSPPQLAQASGAAAATRFYVRLVGIGAYSRLGGVDNTGSVGTGAGSDNNDDFVAGVGLALGLRLDPIFKGLHAEIEFNHRFRYDYDARPAVTGAGAPPRGSITNDLASQSLFFNVMQDIELTTLWGRPMSATLGGGLGVSRHDSDVAFSDLDMIDAGTATPDNRNDEDIEFSFALMAGLNYDITPAVQLGVGYRYVDLGSVKMGAFDNGLEITAEDYISHDVLLNVSYTF